MDMCLQANYEYLRYGSATTTTTVRTFTRDVKLLEACHVRVML